MKGSVVKLAQCFEYAGCDVRAAWIEHGVMVRKRNLGEDLTVDVAVESRPAAVLVLHAQQPVQCPLNSRQRLALCRTVASVYGNLGTRCRPPCLARTCQAHEDHGGVIGVRIK